MRQYSLQVGARGPRVAHSRVQAVAGYHHSCFLLNANLVLWQFVKASIRRGRIALRSSSGFIVGCRIIARYAGRQGLSWWSLRSPGLRQTDTILPRTASSIYFS